MTYKWDNRFKIDGKSIDDQHKVLFELLDKLSQMSENDGTKDQVMAVIDELSKYTDYHFGLEESLMVSKKYDKFTEHKFLHDQFRDQIALYKEQYELIEANEIVSVISHKLQDWLINHILFVDQDYAHELKLK